MPYDMTSKTAGDEISSTYEGRHVEVLESTMTHPYHADGFVDKGEPVHMGQLVGVAFQSALAATDIIAVDTEGIWALSCVASNDAGNSAIARGDRIYINTTTCVLSKITDPATQIFFGIALSTLNAGSTGIVAVKVHQDPNELVHQRDLSDEIEYSQYVCISGQLDNLTYKCGPVESDCYVVHVSFFTNGAAGTGLGFDVIDGGVAGAGTTVINASDDNLNGLDDNELGTPYFLSAGDHINVKADDVGNTFTFVKITLKIILNEET